MEIDNSEQYLIIGCLNTVRLLAEKNISDLEHQKTLREFEKLALLRLKSEVEQINKLHDRLIHIVENIEDLKDICMTANALILVHRTNRQNPYYDKIYKILRKNKSPIIREGLDELRKEDKTRIQ